MSALCPLGPLSRLSSNQDVQLVTRLGGRNKPRLGGIGKAPGARVISGKIRPHTGKHTKAKILKSGRKASITRAKRIASGLAATKEAIAASSSKITRIRRTARYTSIALPNLTTLAEAQAGSDEFLPPAYLATHVDYKSPKLFIFDGRTPTNAVPTLVFKGQGVNLRIPVQPSKLDIPSLQDIVLGAGAVLPALLVRKLLLPLLPRLFIVNSYYQPYPHIASPPRDDPCLNTVTKSFAFGIPQVVNGRDQNGIVANAVRGFEPDACLTIGKRAPSGTVEGPFRVVPINHTVYAAWFSHFPRITNMVPSGHAKGTLSEKNYAPMFPSLAIFSGLDDIEDLDEDDWESQSEDDSENDDNDDDTSSTSSISAASELAELEIPSHIHLPLVTIALPSPETFDLINLRVHTPSLKWQPALLGLGAQLAHSPESALKCLSTVPTPVLARRAKILHGVWANLGALGCDDEAMWSELHSAWTVLIRALVSRTSKV